MSKIRIKTCVLGMVSTNCYIISNDDTKEAIVVDPAFDGEKILEYLLDNQLKCKAILLTHGHFDHILGAKDLVSSLGVQIYAHADEVELLGSAKLNHSAGMGEDYTLTPDILLKSEEMINLCGFNIKVIHTPGHTAGSVCYHFIDEDVLISGDTLFYRDIGRWDLPTGNSEDLLSSLNNKLMLLDDDITAYPGHGETTTIGYEREHNIYVK